MSNQNAAETDALLAGTRGPRIRKVSEMYSVDVEPNTTPAEEFTLEQERSAAKRRLWTAATVCLLFMTAEIIGGYLSGSLAILTDAAHLLSDFASFLISLFALWIAAKPPSNTMSFGYNRAEILGAIVSVFLIWLLTGVLVYEAILRVIHPKPVDGMIMFITAALGFCANIIMAVTLTGHGGGHGADHSHSHGLGAHSHGGPQGRSAQESSSAAAEHGGDAHHESEKLIPKGPKNTNINVRAAFLHVLGDLVQSIGVMIASAVIWKRPDLVVVDPLCTFLFSVLVLFTTVTLLRETIHVLMEGTPSGIDPEELTKDLIALPGVSDVHDVHIWSITVGKPAASFHLTLEPNSGDKGNVLLASQQLVCEKYGIHHSTVQLENPDIESHCNNEGDCNTSCPTNNNGARS